MTSFQRARGGHSKPKEVPGAGVAIRSSTRISNKHSAEFVPAKKNSGDVGDVAPAGNPPGKKKFLDRLRTSGVRFERRGTNETQSRTSSSSDKSWFTFSPAPSQPSTLGFSIRDISANSTFASMPDIGKYVQRKAKISDYVFETALFTLTRKRFVLVE